MKGLVYKKKNIGEMNGEELAVERAALEKAWRQLDKRIDNAPMDLAIGFLGAIIVIVLYLSVFGMPLRDWIPVPNSHTMRHE